MMLTKWTPLRDMNVFHNHLNRFLNGSMWRASGKDGSMATTQWNPAVDIYETDNAIVIDVEIETTQLKKTIRSRFGKRS